MSLKQFCLCLLIILGCWSLNGLAALPYTHATNNFIQRMVDKHQFEYFTVHKILQQADIKTQILQAISKPAEAKPWYQYRKIFLTEQRITEGLKFWQSHAKTLAAVKQRYGIPPEIIVAIIGVETQYGKNVGKHRVLDALSTLGFAYPKRSEFFLQELENFLLLCREEGIAPGDPLGSYAGAMGLPQFMPSSYRNFAVDFQADHRRDIWQNPADAIASVANYFVQHQWHEGERIFVPATADGSAYKAALKDGLELDASLADLQDLGVRTSIDIAPTTKVKLLALELEQQPELWLGLHNFYVITRYNRSPLYAIAVYQLGQALLEKR